MRNFEVTVSLYHRDGELWTRRVLGFTARNMTEAQRVAGKEVLRQLGYSAPSDDLRDVTED